MKNLNEFHANKKKTMLVDGDLLAYKITSALEETIQWEDGNEYPLVKLEISSASHPFFTGKQKLVDSTGRVERFKQRYGSTSTRQAPKQETSSQEEE